MSCCCCCCHRWCDVNILFVLSISIMNHEINDKDYRLPIRVKTIVFLLFAKSSETAVLVYHVWGISSKKLCVSDVYLLLIQLSANKLFLDAREMQYAAWLEFVPAYRYAVRKVFDVSPWAPMQRMLTRIGARNVAKVRDVDKLTSLPNVSTRNVCIVSLSNSNSSASLTAEVEQ